MMTWMVLQPCSGVSSEKTCQLGDSNLVEGGHAAEMTAAVMGEWLHYQQPLCGSNNSFKYDWFVKLALLQVCVCTHWHVPKRIPMTKVPNWISAIMKTANMGDRWKLSLIYVELHSNLELFTDFSWVKTSMFKLFDYKCRKALCLHSKITVRLGTVLNLCSHKLWLGAML